MVSDLKELGYNSTKIRKNKSITYRLLSLKGKKINIVKNHLFHKANKEAENYKCLEINGIQINLPIDKYNYFWDTALYSHWRGTYSKRLKRSGIKSFSSLLFLVKSLNRKGFFHPSRHIINFQ